MGTDISSPTLSPVSILDNHPASAPAAATDAREAAAARAPADAASVREPTVPVPEPDPGPEPVLPPADQPVAVQAEAADRRIDSLLTRASSRMTCLNGTLYETVKTLVPRPGLFRTGHCMHTKVIEAAKACDEAAALFGTIPASEYAKHTLSGKASEALEKFTAAQQNFAAALARFSEKTNTGGEEVSKLIQEANNRTAEALNLVAMMKIAGMEQAPAEGEGAAVAAALADGRIRIDRGAAAADQLLSVGLQMHGAHFSQPLRDGIAAVSAHLDQLEAGRNLLSETEFHNQALRIEDELRTLRENIENVGDAQGGLGEEMTVQRDIGLQEQLSGVLNSLADRYNFIAADVQTSVQDAVKALLPEINSEAFGVFTESPFEALRFYMGTLTRGLTAYVEERNGILDQLGRNELTKDALKAALDSASEKITGLKQEFNLIRLFHTVATNPKCGAGVLGKNLREKFGVHESGDRIEQMAVKLKIMAAAGHPAVRQTEALLGSFATVKKEFVDAEIAEVSNMLQNKLENRQKLFSGYLAAAFEHHVDAATLIGASQRGIPADQLELNVGDRNKISERFLGQGAANAVSLCRYQTDSGEQKEFVFKSEIGAHHGLSHLRAQNVGYEYSVRIMQVNVAATRAADAIGCGETVARSTIGTNNGQIGLFMERAPGKTAGDFIRSGELAKTLKAARKAGTFEIVRANLMRELCRLEWADALAGQVDRHGENYLVDINPADGSVRVTGIDNDASFGSRRIGMDAYDVSGMEGFSRPIVRIRDLDDKSRIDLRNAFGLNQMSVPTHIDRQTYERLMGINLQTYRDSLASCLTEQALQPALSRLADAQYHAARLAEAGRVVDDWNNPQVMREMTEKFRDTMRSGTELAYRMNGFFSRDFLPFFR